MNENRIPYKKKHPETSYRLQVTSYKLNSGITLVELLTGFAIVGVIGIMIGTVYLAHFRLFSTQSTSIDIKTQNTLAMDDITNELKQARYVRKCNSTFDWYNGANAICAGAQYARNLTSTELTIYLWPLDSTGKSLTQTELNNLYCVPSCSDGNFDAVDIINYKLENNQIKKTYQIWDETNDSSYISSRYKNFTTPCGWSTQARCDTNILANYVQDLQFKYYDGTTEITNLTGQWNLIDNVQIEITTQQNTTPPKPSPNTIKQTEKVNFINFEF